ncbi:MAG: ABC transporter permease [Lachnospiraceae bacterium]|nr:ABC transporter permease [Lachnospiraceae bacterium]
MKNPLNKRILREIKDDFGKYAVIFLLMLFTISFISGFLVADGSMIKAYNDSFEKYNVENGHFATENEIKKLQKRNIEENEIVINKQYYVEQHLENEGIIRIYKNRKSVNRVCLMEGKFPEGKNEIAIDRMFADNRNLKVGQTIQTDEETWKITGLVALPDYSCLFADNNDTMFDAVNFGVAVVSDEAFQTFDKDHMTFVYAWKYNKEPENEIREKEVSEDLMDALNSEVTLTEFVPRFQNQAIIFTGDDMGGDRAGVIVIFYIIIVIMAFVFGITSTNTIEKEANVIGTLRASGYTRKELILHYMYTPLLVTLISAILGNILGYTVMKHVCAAMYYGSYSLTTYVTVWNGEAFLLTTVMPIVLMMLINFLILYKKMRLSPLKFIRRDLSENKRKKAMNLNPAMKFFARFRLRVIFQNSWNYVVMVIGIFFANVMLFFGLMMPSVLDNYQDRITESMICKYQYMLNMPVSKMDDTYKLKTMFHALTFEREVETENEDAEKFSAYTLKTTDESAMLEDVLIYGIEKNSKYINLKLGDDDFYISSAYAQKFGIKKGDQVTLKEKYDKDTYTYTVTGIYDYDDAICAFMTRPELNREFNLGEGMFGGYFSNSEITDVDSKYIGTVIDKTALTKVSRQLTVSMGGIMKLISGFAVIIYIILIYLLSKLIIEKNAHAISMAKILGYKKLEIARLYVIPTSLVVVLAVVCSVPIVDELVKIIWMAMLKSMLPGYLPYLVSVDVYVKVIALGIMGYALVALLELVKIGKVPMDMALKNVE